MLVSVTTKETVTKLPAWLKDNAVHNLKVGDVVKRHNDETIEHNKKLIRLGKSYTKLIVKPDAKLVYEWVKTGHWTLAQFNAWLVA